MVKSIKSTPRKDGFRAPGEFEKHHGSWLIWPERSDTWRNGGKPGQQVLVEVATIIAQHEACTVLVSANQYENARARLPEAVRVIELSTDDAWMQDKGPTYVINDKGDIRGVHWGWNAWGGLEEGLYFPWALDAQVGQKVLEIDGIDRYDATHFVLEGGAIQVDGEGTLIITEQCNLNPNRVGAMSRAEVEQNFKEYLNIEKIIWLKRGMAFDETDGHVDDVCFFVKPGVIALSWVDDPTHPQYEVLKESYDILSKATDAKGRQFEIHKIHIPEVIYITDEENEGIDISQSAASREAGLPLAVTYINCYIINDAVLVPQFGDPRDQEACEKLAALFPERQIIPIQSREWSLCGGNVHCMTLMQPAH